MSPGLPEFPAPASAEEAYDALAGYGFAGRYVGGGAVADVGWGVPGPGARLLAKTAASVVGLSSSEAAVEAASLFHQAPGVEYRRADLPELPFPTDHLDAVVALGSGGDPGWLERLAAEAARVCKPGGVFVLSFPDDAAAGDSGREPFRGSLQRRFGRVQTFRLGSVAGGLVVREEDAVCGVSVEDFRSPFSGAQPGGGSRFGRRTVAVCGGEERSGTDHGRPYLLLDNDRLVFEERDELDEDVRLLRDEIRHMQRTEVQAFEDTLALRTSETAHYRIRMQRQADHYGIRMQRLADQNERLRGRLHEIETSRTWKLLGLYRSLRERLGA